MSSIVSQSSSYALYAVYWRLHSLKSSQRPIILSWSGPCLRPADLLSCCPAVLLPSFDCHRLWKFDKRFLCSAPMYVYLLTLPFCASSSVSVSRTCLSSISVTVSVSASVSVFVFVFVFASETLLVRVRTWIFLIMRVM